MNLTLVSGSKRELVSEGHKSCGSPLGFPINLFCQGLTVSGVMI